MTKPHAVHALFVSPHLDDAVFSCGGLIARLTRAGIRCTVLTALTGNVAQPAGFALRCQTDKGIDPTADYMALRRAEDEAACRVLGAAVIHLPHLEAPHRGYDSPAALFGELRQDDEAETAIARSLETAMEETRPDLVLAPYGLGDHVDHRIVRAATERLTDAMLWQDEPYAQKQRLSLPNSTVLPLDEEAHALKCQAMATYATQLGFQFDGRDGIARLMPRSERVVDTHGHLARLLKPIGLERFHNLSTVINPCQGLEIPSPLS